MSPEFWRLFGYDPSTKQHRASEWKDLIDPDDLVTVEHNFAEHFNRGWLEYRKSVTEAGDWAARRSMR